MSNKIQALLFKHWCHRLSLVYLSLAPRNGANGAILIDPLITNDHRHWRQWRWGAPLAPLGPLPLASFLSPLAQMAPMARITSLNDNLIMLQTNSNDIGHGFMTCCTVFSWDQWNTQSRTCQFLTKELRTPLLAAKRNWLIMLTDKTLLSTNNFLMSCYTVQVNVLFGMTQNYLSQLMYFNRRSKPC